MPETVCLAFTGASGMPYGVRLLECLLAAGCRVQLLYSQVAQIVARQEMGLDLPARASEARAGCQRGTGRPGGTLPRLAGPTRGLRARRMVRAARQWLQPA